MKNMLKPLQMMISSKDINLRKTFLGISSQDSAVLGQHRSRLRSHSEAFVSNFYQHLQRFQPLQQLLNSPEKTEYLKKTLIHYYDTLVAGHCNRDYVKGRLKIGQTHQQIGLELKWYSGAYALYLNHMLPPLWQDPELDQETCTHLTQALVKRVFFDMGLALETYAHSERQQISALKTYAERIIESAPCGLAVTTRTLKILTANPKLAKMLECKNPVNRQLDALLSVPDLSNLANSVLHNRCTFALNFEYVRSNGRHCLYHIEIAPIKLHDLFTGEGDYGLVFSIEDFTEQEALKLFGSQKNAHLEALMSSVPDGIVTFRADGTLEAWNLALEKLFGYSAQELQGSNITKLLFQQQYQPIFAHRLLEHLWQHKREHLEVFGLKKDGNLLHLEIAVNSVNHANPPLFLAVIHDVSARKKAEADLHQMARYDSLTHLPNRDLYLERLQAELSRAHRYQKLLAVMFLDLDDFKQVNDNFGHLVGDLLLQEVSNRLSQQIRETDIVARFGGDEFTFVITDLTSTESAHTIANKILEAFHQPFSLKGREFFIKASIGISLYPIHSHDPHTLLRYADAAMYRAKFQGHNRICCYNAEMEAEAAHQVTLESELHRALERRELSLVYQPKIMLQTGTIMGFEALLRWHNQQLGNVPPDRFIPALENLGLIQEVGEWCLRTALTQVGQWQMDYHRPLQIAVNISSHQIGEELFAEQVLKLLEEMNLPAHSLELEITETALMEQNRCTMNNIHTLRDSGVRFAIDDFGTGYSSLSYLRNFPFNTLKIDRIFIEHLDTVEDLALAQHIVGIGHSLGLQVVAEGVEDQAQLAKVTSLKCDQVQGYLFHRPMMVNEVENVLKDAFA